MAYTPEELALLRLSAIDFEKIRVDDALPLIDQAARDAALRRGVERLRDLKRTIAKHALHGAMDPRADQYVASAAQEMFERNKFLADELDALLRAGEET